MKNYHGQIFAITLIFINLILTFSSVTVSASELGTVEAPYLISTEEQLLAVAAGNYGNNSYENFSAHYKLQNDITLTADEWTPIGGNGKPAFTGVFDGNGYKISNVRISESYSYAGLFGENSGTIRHLGVEAEIHSLGSTAGCLAGRSNGTVQYCYSSGSVYGSSAGGLIGFNSGVGTNDIGLVENCYSRADAEAYGGMWYKCAGGLIGYVNAGDVRRSYSAGKTEGPSELQNPGAMIGASYSNSALVFYCYFNGEDEGYQEFGISTSALKEKTTYMGWDFENVWDVSPNLNEGYPFLRPNGVQGSPYIEGSGTSPSNPYLITNETQLIALAAGDFENSQTSCYKLQNNITLTVKRWHPIRATFQGRFDGNGFKISNINIPTNQRYTYTGLFMTNEGTIQNLGVSGTFKSGETVGALVGRNRRRGLIENCYSEGSISNTSLYGGGAGGLVGENSNEASSSNNPRILNCYSTADVSGYSRAGGLVGYADGGTISSTYATGRVTRVISGSGVSGGLIGGVSSDTTTTANSNYYDMQSTGQGDTTKGADPLLPYEMKMRESFIGWNFDTIWDIDDEINSGYPYLRVFQKQPVLYNVTVDGLANGAVTATPTTAVSGTIISLTVIPNPEYILKEGTLKYNGNTVVGNGFTMPAADVVVTAEFEPLPPADSLTVTSILVTDMQGVKIDKLAAEITVKVTARIYNSMGAIANPVMIIVLYDSYDRLLDVRLEDSLGIVDEQYGNIIATYQLPKNIVGKKMKVMVWNSIDTMMPLLNEPLIL